MKRCLSCGESFAASDWGCPGCGFAPAARDGFPVFAPHLADHNSLFDAKSFGGLAAAEESSFWFPPRNRLIAWALKKYFPEARSFLEVGCGTGIALAGIAASNPNLTLTGVEVFLDGLAHARERLGPRAELMQADALHLPFREAFDVVGTFDVVEHIEDDVGALAEMNRALRPGGGLLVIVPQHMWLWSRVDDLAGHRRRYVPAGLARAVEAAGFRMIRLMSFGALTLPLQWVSRRIIKPKGETLAETLEIDLPTPLTAGLRALLEIDMWTVRHGVDWPFGASLFAVARKI